MKTVLTFLLLLSSLQAFCSSTLLAEYIMHSDVDGDPSCGVQVHTSGKVYNVCKKQFKDTIISKKLFLTLTSGRVEKFKLLAKTIKGPLQSYTQEDGDEGVYEWSIMNNGKRFVFAKEGGMEGSITNQQNAHLLKELLLSLDNLGSIYPVEK